MVNFPVDVGTFVIIDYIDVDFNNPKTLLGKIVTISCYQCVDNRQLDDFIVMVSGYKDNWCREYLLSKLVLASDEVILMYKKEMGIL